MTPAWKPQPYNTPRPALQKGSPGVHPLNYSGPETAEFPDSQTVVSSRKPLLSRRSRVVANCPPGVAITVMVRNPDKTQNGCRIFYRDIGDYLTGREKRQTLVDLGSINGIQDWQPITPDRHNDWINQSRHFVVEVLLPRRARSHPAPNSVGSMAMALTALPTS